MLAGIKMFSTPWSLHAYISSPYVFRKARSRWCVRGSSPAACDVRGLKPPLPKTHCCPLWSRSTTAVLARRPMLALSKMETNWKRKVGTRSRRQLGVVRWRSCQTDEHTPRCVRPVVSWCVPVRSGVEVCTPRKRKPHRCWPSFLVRCDSCTNPDSIIPDSTVFGFSFCSYLHNKMSLLLFFYFHLSPRASKQQWLNLCRTWNLSQFTFTLLHLVLAQSHLCASFGRLNTSVFPWWPWQDHICII